MSYRAGKEIIRQALENRSVDEIADELDVNVAHIYNVEYRGVSPTLHRALIDEGWMEPPPKVYTLAFRFRDRAAFERARDVVDAGGDRTTWLMEQIDG